MRGTWVYSTDRGVRKLKPGADFQIYQNRHADAIKVRKPPCLAKLETWHAEGGCEALDGCWVEPDGECRHGLPSWLRALNMI